MLSHADEVPVMLGPAFSVGEAYHKYTHMEPESLRVVMAMTEAPATTCRILGKGRGDELCWLENAHVRN